MLELIPYRVITWALSFSAWVKINPLSGLITPTYLSSILVEFSNDIYLLKVELSSSESWRVLYFIYRFPVNFREFLDFFIHYIFLERNSIYLVCESNHHFAHTGQNILYNFVLSL